MTLEEALNKAAGELPAGAEIHIVVERDAATVSASDWDGNWREDFDSADMSLAEQVDDCVAWCKVNPPSNDMVSGGGTPSA